MHIEIAPKARYQLLKMTDYFAEYGGQKAVDHLLDQIVTKQQQILKHPEAYHPEPLLSGRRFVYRSVIINKHYKMIYRVEPDVIRVSAFWDMRMSPENLRKRI